MRRYPCPALGLLLPLATLFYLARVLGPAGLGLLAAIQGFCVFVGLFIEYGFTISAARELDECRNSKAERARVMSGVLSAQLLFAVLSVLAALAASHFIPLLASHPVLLLWGLIGAVGAAFGPRWYFQGMQLVAPAAVLAATFGFVHRPEDAWIALAIQAAAAMLSTAIALGRALRENGMAWPSVDLMTEQVRRGGPDFVVRAAESAYSLGNAFILAQFTSLSQVGYYAAAEQIGKSILVTRNRVAGCLLGVVVFVSAPLLVHIILGPGYEAAVPVVQILALLAPMWALVNSWQPKPRILIPAALLKIALAALLTPRFGAAGMAWSMVIAEAFLCTGTLVASSRRRYPVTVYTD